MAENFPHMNAYARQLDFIIRTVNVEDLLPKLFSEGCISPRDYEKIKRKLNSEGPTAAAELLFVEMLLRNPDKESFKKVKEAMELSGQTALATKLQREYEKILNDTSVQDSRQTEGSTKKPSVSTKPTFPMGIEQPLDASPLVHEAPGFRQHREQEFRAGPSPLLYAENPVGGNRGVQNWGPMSGGLAYAAGNNAGFNVTNTASLNLNAEEHALLNTVPQVDIGELHIDRNNRLGCGQFGVVYRSTWKGTDVAVKEMPIQFRRKSKGQELAGVTKEIQISARIRHPHIIQIMAFSIAKDSFCIVYELIDGRNLEQIIFEEEDEAFQLTRLNKLTIARQLCQALSYLHESNPMVIHGDIKPANIMVSRLGLVSKLCDLGMSKLKSKHAHTTTGLYKAGGTPLYMPPEQLIYNKAATTRTDVYTFGATLLELFSETELWEFEDGEKMENITQHMAAGKMPTALRELEEGQLKILITQCLSHNEQLRPTALQIVDRLKQCN